jgi:hypothetical protein
MPPYAMPSRDQLRRMREIADAGNVRAQQELGKYYMGDGEAQNYSEGSRFFHLAADQGDAWSQCSLGKFYAREGVAQNLSEAARLFGLAADQGDAGGQCLLAACYMAGIGVPVDVGEGRRLFTLSAEQGEAQAQLCLARLDREAGIAAAAVPREAARSIARDLAQKAISEDPVARAAALGVLGDFADDRAVARTCCIGCGKTEQLQVCAKCMTAKFCSRECQQRMWPTHKPACKAWVVQKAAADMEAGARLIVAQALSEAGR